MRSAAGDPGAQGLAAAKKGVKKDYWLGAAWGAVWDDSHLARTGESARIAADLWVKKNNAWVRREMIPPTEYWKTMSKFRFHLAPPGAGVQAPKFAEAWAMRAVPVTLRYPAFVDLQKLGFPLVLVSTWDDLTLHTLEAYYDSPQYKNIDWNHVLQMLHLGPWSKQFLC